MPEELFERNSGRAVSNATVIGGVVNPARIDERDRSRSPPSPHDAAESGSHP